MLIVLFMLVVLPGVAAGVMTKPYEPSVRLAPVRALVALMVVAAGGMLGVSLGRDWWVVDDYERERTIVTDGSSGFVRTVVAVALACCVVTVLAAWGRRNWAPLALTFGWLLLAIAVGETVDSDANSDALSGLKLASWALLLVTGAAVIASVGRLLERRAREERWRSTVRGREVNGRDVAVAAAMAVVVVATLFDIVPGALFPGLALAALIVAVVRVCTLVATRARPR